MIFLGILVLLTLINILVTSGSAMWSLTAPILVPMMLLLSVPAETTQALFRIADSGSTAITPMSPYFVMALGFLQRYRKDAGVGTLASYTVPLASLDDHRLDPPLPGLVGPRHPPRPRSARQISELQSPHAPTLCTHRPFFGA